MAPPFKRPLRACMNCGKTTRNAKYCSHGCYGKAEQAGIAERFWAKVAKGDGCWEWQGYRRPGPRPYGVYGARTPTYTHRMAYRLSRGPIPLGAVVMHLCDNPPCCNPAHLQVGTSDDNIADATRKGRMRKDPMVGAANPAARLTVEQVREIRLRAAGGEAQKALAQAFGVGTSTVHRIATRQGWKDVA